MPASLPHRPAFFTPKTRWGLAVLVAIWGSLALAGVGRPGADLFNWGGLGQVGEFLSASLHPDLSRDFLTVIGRASLVTFAYAVCGTALSVGLGLVGGVLSAAIWWRTVLPQAGWGRWLGQPIWLGVRGLLAFPRAIHELIWGLFFLNIVGLDPLVAVLAIAIPFGAIVAKVFSEILDETPHEPLQALLNSGVPPLTALLYGLLPQALPNLLAYTFYRFECSLRAAAVLGVIGAGGLGYEILLSLQSLRYEQLWTGFYALVVLNGLVDMWSALVRRRMGFTSRLDINAGRLTTPAAAADLETGEAASTQPVPPKGPDWLLRGSWVAVAMALPLCFGGLQIDWSRLGDERTRRLLGEVAAAASPQWPDLETWWELGRLSALTLAMSILAIAIATLGGILFSFPAAQNVWLPGGLLRSIGERSQTGALGGTLLLGGSRLILLISRAIPAPIWALVFLFVFFPGILPGALALAVHNFGILGRLMAEVNENLDDRPVRSLRGLGASAGQVILYGILPQNLGRFLAYSLYRWEVCMRETVIVGLVGAGGLGRLMTEQISSFDYAGLTLTLGCFVILTFGVDLVSQQMRAALR